MNLPAALVRDTGKQRHISAGDHLMAIQPHGLLLAADDLWVVRHVSTNVEELLGLTLAQVIGTPISQLIGGEQFKHLAALPLRGEQRIGVCPISLRGLGAGRNFVGQIHYYNGLYILDLEPAGADYQRPLVEGDFTDIQAILGSNDDDSSFLDYMQAVAERLSVITEFDQVTIYRLDNRWDGEVLAEHCAPHQREAYREYHFATAPPPLEGIDLRLRNCARHIYDVSGTEVTVTPNINAKTGQPIDLVFSSLRCFSRERTAYVRESGAEASLFIPLINTGKLWGMIICFHHTPKRASFRIREMAGFVGKLVSDRISNSQDRRKQAIDSGRRVILFENAPKRLLCPHDPDPSGKICPHDSEQDKQANCIYERRLPYCSRSPGESPEAPPDHDHLTGFPGRSLFEKLARETLIPNGPSQPPTPSTITVLDINQFKVVNESMGYGAGDRLLYQVASRIADNLRDTDVLARWGGDRFAVLLPGVASEADASTTVQRLLESLARPFFVSGQMISITASAGIAICPRDGAAPDILMYAADNALNHAKASGQGKICFFREEFAEATRRRYELAADLRRGIKAKQFFLLYQPQVDAHTLQPIGLEALVRWNHPIKGIISPLDFISVAEDIGAIEELGAEIFRMACSQIRAWRKEGNFSLRVGVNISPRQLSPDLPKFIANTIKQYGVPASLIEAELTESSIQPTPEILAVMDELRTIGISLAIDDFGTGYSSLAHLKRFRFNRLKIDKSFVDGIPNNLDENAIVKAIIALGSALRTNILAEGVESDAQAAFLRNEGVNVLQGFLYNRPLAAQDVLDYIAASPQSAQAIRNEKGKQ